MKTFEDSTIKKFQFEISDLKANNLRENFNMKKLDYNTSCDQKLIWVNFPINCSYANIGIQNNNKGYYKTIPVIAAKELIYKLNN